MSAVLSRLLPIALTLSWSLLAGACAAPGEAPPTEATAMLATSLRTLKLPVGAPNAMAHDSVWHVHVASGTPARLHLIRNLAALVLPDGPIELTEPVTAYRFTDGRWQVLRGPRLTSTLPASLDSALIAECVDVDRSYFFLVAVFDATADWMRAAPAQRTDRLAELTRRMDRDAARLRASGFISADAEP